MIVIFSILMYPIFFIIAYILGEYIYPTRNGAMLFAFLCAFVFSYLYYTIRTKVSQLTEKKKSKKQKRASQLTALLLVDEKHFKNCFPKNSLADNSYTGVNEEKVLEFLRNNTGIVNIYSVKGITDGARDLLNLIKREYTVHTEDEIISYAYDIIPIIEVKNESRIQKMKKGFLSPQFRKFALKYGVILLLLSLITPYKFYYIFVGISLILYSFSQKFIKKISQRSQIPYPRS